MGQTTRPAAPPVARLPRVLLGAVLVVALALAGGCSTGGDDDPWASGSVDTPTWTAVFPGLGTERDGTGSWTVSYRVEPGPQVLNVFVLAIDKPREDERDEHEGPTEWPLTIAPDGFAELSVPGAGVEQVLYGETRADDEDEGLLGCPEPWAHDLSHPIGKVRYQPTSDAIDITVTLDQAVPDRQYGIQVNTEGTCAGPYWG